MNDISSSIRAAVDAHAVAILHELLRDSKRPLARIRATDSQPCRDRTDDGNHATRSASSAEQQQAMSRARHDVERIASTTVCVALGRMSTPRVQVAALECLLAVVKGCEDDRRVGHDLVTRAGVGMYLDAVAGTLLGAAAPGRLEAPSLAEDGPCTDATDGETRTHRSLIEAPAAAALVLHAGASLLASAAARAAKQAMWTPVNQREAAFRSNATSMPPCAALCVAVVRQYADDGSTAIAGAAHQAMRFAGNLCFGMDDAASMAAKAVLGPVLMPLLLCILRRAVMTLEAPRSTDRHQSSGNASRGLITTWRDVRWATHAVSSLVYGRAPNALQRAAVHEYQLPTEWLPRVVALAVAESRAPTQVYRHSDTRVAVVERPGARSRRLLRSEGRDLVASSDAPADGGLTPHGHADALMLHTTICSCATLAAECLGNCLFRLPRAAVAAHLVDGPHAANMRRLLWAVAVLSTQQLVGSGGSGDGRLSPKGSGMFRSATFALFALLGTDSPALRTVCEGSVTTTNVAKSPPATELPPTLDDVEHAAATIGLALLRRLIASALTANGAPSAADATARNDGTAGAATQRDEQVVAASSEDVVACWRLYLAAGSHRTAAWFRAALEGTPRDDSNATQRLMSRAGDEGASSSVVEEETRRRRIYYGEEEYVDLPAASEAGPVTLAAVRAAFGVPTDVEAVVYRRNPFSGVRLDTVPLFTQLTDVVNQYAAAAHRTNGESAAAAAPHTIHFDLQLVVEKVTDDVRAGRAVMEQLQTLLLGATSAAAAQSPDEPNDAIASGDDAAELDCAFPASWLADRRQPGAVEDTVGATWPSCDLPPLARPPGRDGVVDATMRWAVVGDAACAVYGPSSYNPMLFGVPPSAPRSRTTQLQEGDGPPRPPPAAAYRLGPYPGQPAQQGGQDYYTISAWGVSRS